MLYETTNWGSYEGDSDYPESYVTNDDTCSGCGWRLDLDDLVALDFQVEESGVQPATPDGPAVYWASGTICCPNCGDQLPFETSS